ncbi:MAG: hypothetical protein B7Y25_08520 [Alphaproteobacteria bacterium 16-39-46]|nr:MAG: hypothetical protein B7Y25_08520 [Alphaproteobacteria bacterium 16-39-46]OZA41030.1 MAG: hypothetical protein B7X84_08695 [Alphaproteobacteria bacterium 17-39-52]
MIEREEDVLDYRHFPKVHRRKIYSNNPLERLNHEIRQRTNVMRNFPKDTSALFRVLPGAKSKLNNEIILVDIAHKNTI